MDDCIIVSSATQLIKTPSRSANAHLFLKIFESYQLTLVGLILFCDSR